MQLMHNHLHYHQRYLLHIYQTFGVSQIVLAIFLATKIRLAIIGTADLELASKIKKPVKFLEKGPN